MGTKEFIFLQHMELLFGQREQYALHRYVMIANIDLPSTSLGYLYLQRDRVGTSSPKELKIGRKTSFLNRSKTGRKTLQLCLTSTGQEGSLTVHPFSSGKRSGEDTWNDARLQCSQLGADLSLLLQELIYHTFNGFQL